MAKKRSVQARVRVRVSFNGLRAGDEADVEMEARVQGWIDAGLMEVVSGGESASGSSGSESDDHERVPSGAARGVPSGGESGQGFGAGGYGTVEVVDQG